MVDGANSVNIELYTLLLQIFYSLKAFKILPICFTHKHHNVSPQLDGPKERYVLTLNSSLS